MHVDTDVEMIYRCMLIILYQIKHIYQYDTHKISRQNTKEHHVRTSISYCSDF